MNDETKELSVTQVVDIDNCREKAAMYTGIATAVLDNISKQVCSSYRRAEFSCTFSSLLFLCVLPSRRENLSCQQ